MAFSSIEHEDALFERPRQPASAPRVRSFAERALKEVRLVEGGTSLLTDKKAFAEFMYRVNESVLLGLNGPPTAASVLNADDERSGKQSVGRTPPETTAPSPLRSVEIGRDEPPMSPIHPSKSFAQWRRQGDSSNPISPLPPASMRSDRLRVRFDVDDDDRRAPGLSTAISRPRTQTDEEESTNSDESDGGSLLACDTDRRKMLEDLRRWRAQALSEIKHSPKPFRRPPSLLQPPRPPSPPLDRDSPKSRTSSRHCAEPTTNDPRRTTPVTLPLPIEHGGNHGPEAKGAREARSTDTPRMVRVVVNGHEGKLGGGSTESEAEASETAESEKGFDRRLNCDQQVSKIDRGIATKAVRVRSPGFLGCYSGHGRERTGKRSVCADCGGGGQGESPRLSLDLSNCSDEKLKHLLEQGRRGVRRAGKSPGDI